MGCSPGRRAKPRSAMPWRKKRVFCASRSRRSAEPAIRASAVSVAATISEAHSAVIRWIEANAYQICGPIREINLQFERGGDPDDFVTEIQYPVQKV